MLFSSCYIKQTLTIRLNNTASNISSLFILLCSSWKLALVISLNLHAFNYLYASQIFSLFLLWPRITRAHLTHSLLFINLCLCFSLICSLASVPQAFLCKSLLSCRQSCTGPSQRCCPTQRPQGFHTSASSAEESHRLVEVHVCTTEAQVLPSPAVLS